MRLTDAESLKRFEQPYAQNTVLLAVVVGFLVLAIAVLDGIFGPDAPIAHLYYLPILLSGAKLGRRAAIGVALTATLLFHFLDPKRAVFQYTEADIMQLVLFSIVALVSSRLAEQARELHRLATTDDLTGLHNLRSFEAKVRRNLETVANRGRGLAMIALDVDRLKKINDAHGHLVGAEVVRFVGQVVAQQVPARATACRYGGDEFMIFLPLGDEAQASACAEAICASVREAAPILAGVRFARGALSVSIGVTLDEASGAVGSGELAERMFRDADRALYDAKEAGRGVVVVRAHTT